MKTLIQTPSQPDLKLKKDEKPIYTDLKFCFKMVYRCSRCNILYGSDYIKDQHRQICMSCNRKYY